MTDQAEYDRLKRTRSALKGRLTKLNNSLAEFLEKDATHKFLSLKRERAISIADEFKEVQQKVEQLPEIDIDRELEYRASFEDELDLTLSQFDQLLKSSDHDSKPLQKINEQFSRTNLNLPTINIPNFNGNFREFFHFRDVFESLIINNNELSNIQKFHYLLSAVQGEPRDLIKNIPITDSNFRNAYDLIIERYNNKRIIATNHVHALLNLPSVNRNNTEQLRKLINEVKTNCDAIKALELEVSLDQLLLTQMVLDKVDLTTRAKFESLGDSKQIASLVDLISFLENKCQTDQLIQSSPLKNTSFNAKQSRTDKSLILTNSLCQMCKGTHRIHKCQNYLALDPTQRKQKVIQFHLCLNCLNSGHNYKNCTSRTLCFKCNKRHHTSIHLEPLNDSRILPNNPLTAGQGNKIDKLVPSISTSCYAHQSSKTQVLLATALIKVKDAFGNYKFCRALLDNGSQVNFITERMCQLLKLKKTKQAKPIESFGNLSHMSKHNVEVQIESRTTSFSINTNCSVLSRITSDLPTTHIDNKRWNIPEHIKLADPAFNVPQRVDLLLGAQIFMKILEMEQHILPGILPILQKTKLGWIVSGEYCQFSQPKKSSLSHSFLATHDDSLEKQLRKFWEQEEITEPVWSVEERQCEDHFRANTSRDKTGRYCVKLPFKKNPSMLGSSREIAFQRLHRLERRLMANQQLNKDYHQFLREYLSLGHMRLAEPTHLPCYYLPHHAVFKKDSTTTRTRVVFDASCQTDKGISLNDILMIGAVVQQDLCSIILRFRTHSIAFIADINKMYRQINVAQDDYNYQRILWRESSTEPIQEYQLTTVTYGTSAAPYLATRCLQQLAEDEQSNFSNNAISILKNDFYVDDCISGSSTLKEAINVASELQSLLASGGFQLRKWASNSSAFIETIPSNLREACHNLNENETVKALGLRWNCLDDQFQIISGIKSPQHRHQPSSFSKRQILAIISSIFDPLGLLAPTVILCKIFMQQLWKEHLQWDDKLSDTLAQHWLNIYNSLPNLNNIFIDRLVLINNNVNLQLHGFADASEKAYGACLYVRSADPDGTIMVRLLCAKSRVAPLKRVSLPRLELCGAVLLVRLVVLVERSLGLKFNNINLWTDSTIVLSWINKCPSTLKTFVANRISKIQQTTHHCSWRHVPSNSNPADLVSRGILPQHLINNDLWWHGPNWLNDSSLQWPEIIPICDELPEVRKVVSLVVTNPQEYLNKYSRLVTLQRIMAYCLRFVANCKLPTTFRQTGPLKVTELNTALLTCIKLAQDACYTREILALKNKQRVNKGSALLELNPFIDNTGILRVGGRLQNSSLPYETKHQIILPPKHHLTRLIIEREHQRLLHAGSQLLIGSLRNQYWIPKARQVVRQIIHKCAPCFRLKASSQTQLMGNLPPPRVQPSRAFQNTGIDYAGPINIKIGSHRSKQLVKAYIAVFVCLATKAVHLEVVSDLTTETFLAALRRFMARRGRCRNIYSDNGTTFVGASNEIKNLYAFLKREDQHIANILANESCQWHFIPAKAPHFGGLWEGAVKSMKYHLRRILGNSSLTFEEITTLLTQIEACMNSRPLSKMSTDPSDPMYLTPGHFLIGEPLNNLPDPDLSDVSVNRLSRWQRIQQLNQHLWQRWSVDYLTSMQQRSKWATLKQNQQIGSVVLIKDDNLPPMKWKLGVVEALHPGSDGLVRVVSLRTDNGIIKRPIVKICPLPLPNEEEDQQLQQI